MFNKYEVSVLQDKAVWQVNGSDECRVDVLCVAGHFQMVKVVSTLVTLAYNSSIQEVKAGDQEFNVSLG